MSKKVCGLCNGNGLYPFCGRCDTPIDLSMRVVEPKPKKVRVDYAEQNRQEILRHKYLENRKDLTRMVKSMLKVTVLSDEIKENIEIMIEDGLHSYIEVASYMRRHNLLETP